MPLHCRSIARKFLKNRRAIIPTPFLSACLPPSPSLRERECSLRIGVRFHTPWIGPSGIAAVYVVSGRTNRI
jgi:hypothetical protein